MVLQSHFLLCWGHWIKNVLKKPEVKSLLEGKRDKPGTCKWGTTFEVKTRVEINMEFHCHTAIKGNRAWIGMSKRKGVVGTALVRSTLALRNPEKSFQWQPPGSRWIYPFQKKPLEVFNSRRWAWNGKGMQKGPLRKQWKGKSRVRGRDGNQEIPDGKHLLDMDMENGPCSVLHWILGCSSKPMSYKAPLHFLTFSSQIRFPSGRDTSAKYELNLKEKVIGLDKTVTRWNIMIHIIKMSN